MISNRCKLAVKEELTKLGLHFIVADLGEVEIMEEITSEQRSLLQAGLQTSGLELMDDKRAILIEKVINVITEMIHHSDDEPKMNYSDYISEKVQYDYTYLSNLFTEIKGINIRQFIILHKIERVKELLFYEELNLTEIAYKMHYSSVAHLSNQFKKMTGLTPSEYKQLKENSRNTIEDLSDVGGRSNGIHIKEVK